MLANVIFRTNKKKGTKKEGKFKRKGRKRTDIGKYKVIINQNAKGGGE
jgi:hypothetical protein